MALMRALILVLCCFGVVSLAACGRSGTSNVNRASANNAAGSAANTNANAPPAEALASGQLDAEIARLEAQAEQNPEDETARAAVAAAYVRRANALRDTGKMPEAQRDYQTALRFNPDNE